MSKKEYTKEQLVALIERYCQNGKVSKNDLADIIYDSDFPKHMFDEAHKKLIEYRDEEQRFKELGKIFGKKYSEILDISKKVIVLMDVVTHNDDDEDKIVTEIYDLKQEQKDIENSLEEMEIEFNELMNKIKARIDYKK
jgi:hypothetical protein